MNIVGVDLEVPRVVVSKLSPGVHQDTEGLKPYKTIGLEWPNGLHIVYDMYTYLTILFDDFVPVMFQICLIVNRCRRSYTCTVRFACFRCRGVSGCHWRLLYLGPHRCCYPHPFWGRCKGYNIIKEDQQTR